MKKEICSLDKNRQPHSHQWAGAALHSHLAAMNHGMWISSTTFLFSNDWPPLSTVCANDLWLKLASCVTFDKCRCLLCHTVTGHTQSQSKRTHSAQWLPSKNEGSYPEPDTMLEPHLGQGPTPGVFCEPRKGSGYWDMIKTKTKQQQKKHEQNPKDLDANWGLKHPPTGALTSAGRSF